MIVALGLAMAWAGAAIPLVVLLWGRLGLAEASSVPPEIQAQLLSKLMTYDRNFTARAGESARLLVIVKTGTVKSELSARTMMTALGQLERVGGLFHKETLVPYEGVASLAARVRKDRIAIVYVTAGLEDEIEAMRAAFSGIDLLTVAAVPEYVPRGIVLGFELQSGKPKISLNLQQARLQSVKFESTVLNLMKVYR